jgi:peptidoglycan DL-endopeptidase CwlO
MTMIEAIGRIDQIESTLLQLSGTKTGPAKTDASAMFAASLASALGTAKTAATSSTIPNPGAATGTDVVASAEKYLGVPYVFGGEDSSGMDCSGLVQRVYADLGIEVPRLVSGQMKIGTAVGSLAEAKPGDLIVTGGGDHILIYAGNNKVIHAPYEGRTVSLVDAYMKDSDIDTIRRVIPDRGTVTAAATASAAAMSAMTSANSVTSLTSTLGAGGGSDLISAALAALARGGAQ